MNAPRWLPAAAVTLFAACFTWLNRGERVAVDVGMVTFYRAPLTVVLFLAFVAGMLSMLALSLRHDRRVREELRARGLLDAPPSSSRAAASAWGAAPSPAVDATEVAEPAPAAEPPSPFAPPAEREHAAEERTEMYPRYGEVSAAHPAGEDRTELHPHHDGGPPREDRTELHSRYDRDPAA